MLDFGKIKLTENELDLIETSVESYKRFARVDIEVRPISEDLLTVKISQYAPPPNGKILTRGELLDRAEAVFKDLLPRGSYTINPVPFEG